jgi:hypothetical protein
MLADQVHVHYKEGAMTGFLVVRSLEGQLLADGEMSQLVDENRVSSHLVFRFKDGSVYDDSAVFSQRDSFRLLTDHLIERGPSFKQPMETSLDSSTGQVTIRYAENGKEKTRKDRLGLPPDIANGLLFTLLKDIQPSAPQTVVSYVAFTPKPRIVQLVIVPKENVPVSHGTIKLKALHYLIKVKIGGIAGAIAPIIGKQPPDMQQWIVQGEAPAFVKFQGPLAYGGPQWQVELATPATFP